MAWGTKYSYVCVNLQVTKGKEEHAFYSLPEFEEWKAATSNWNTWKIKYYKGLTFLAGLQIK